MAATVSHAQQDLNTAGDAVRFATDNINGTARFRAMSGAFGALGGDVSAMNVNPAGSAVFNFNSGTASLTSYNISNNSLYYGSEYKKRDNSIDLNQIGAVFVFNNTREGAVMNKFTLGFNYENTNNFDNSIFTVGVNPVNSVDQYFLRYANGIGNEGGIRLETLNTAYYGDLNYIDQQAYLGYNAYIFNPVSETAGNTQYVSNVPQGSNYYHESYINTTGYNGKVALNFAAQLMDRVYIGTNVNVHFTDYVKNSSFYEEYSPSSTGLRAVEFNTERYTYGGGFSFNLGTIIKITDGFRAGLAYESPTWYRLQDELRQNIISDCADCGGSNLVIVDEGITFIFDDYTIRTPSKWTGSMAYVFGNNGLLSIDYSLKDYSNTEFTNNRYSAINSELSNTLDMAGEIRVGGEYRIKNISLRGGYRYEQSPYKNNTEIGDLWGASGGIGFTFGNSRFDLAYSYFDRKMNVPLLNAGFTDAAKVKSNNNNVTLSYTLDL